MLYGGRGGGTGLQVINNLYSQWQGQGSWGQMALVSGFGNSLRMVRSSRRTGGSQDTGSSSRYGFPLPLWLSLAPQPGPTRQGKGERCPGSFCGARAGEKLSLQGPGSGPQLEGQGWSWRTGELKEKCKVNWKYPGSVQPVCLSHSWVSFCPPICVSPYLSSSPEFLHYLPIFLLLIYM